MPSLEVVGPLDPTEVRAVSGLVEAATEADGVRPLSEHVMLHLRYGGDEPVRNVLAWVKDGVAAGDLAGYAHLDVTDEVEGASAELVVAPAHRGRGVGRALVRATLAETPDGRLRLWSHGGHPGAAALAATLGFVQSRALWQMRRSLYAALPLADLPAGVSVREFVPGADDEAWVALNSAAFRGHPEQAHGLSTTCTDGSASPGSTRPASSWPSARTTAARGWSDSTGRRSTVARGRRTPCSTSRTPTRARPGATATSRSGRSTSSVSTRPSAETGSAGR